MRRKRSSWLPCKVWASTPPFIVATQQHNQTLRILADDNAIQFDDNVDVTPSDGKPLLFFYDCETTGGSYHRDHITEVAAVVEVPDGVHINTTEYSSLCHTSRHIPRKGT